MIDIEPQPATFASGRSVPLCGLNNRCAIKTLSLLRPQTHTPISEHRGSLKLAGVGKASMS
jgi:hypothetical protein